MQAEQEEAVYLQLTELLKCTESVEGSKPYEKDVNRINELIKVCNVHLFIFTVH